ncbi:adenylosuccinate lyase [Candidatus Providencia siddallii]|uniref:Adenylosuccinate lyase n=1 Tax=Candidatus Providencia siddallii TaxID=1715285 RepID=A0ABP1CFK2_9GAMM
MKLSSLSAISPIDGRYADKVSVLRPIFSEFGLLKFRVQVEIFWLKKISEIEKIKEVSLLSKSAILYLNKIISNFSEQDAIRIKEIERITNHDIKAVEYFLKEKVSSINELCKISDFFHFACTSEDINNISYALMLKITREKILLPKWQQIINTIKTMALKYKNIPLLSRTHGQPATPSTVGKEFANIVYRLKRQYVQFEQTEILAKINGAVGNYNAHMIAYPDIRWHKISEEFITSLGLKWNPFTTQIEPHDYMSEFFDCIIRFNTIILNFDQDIWGYIALNHFKQKKYIHEIGSSTMPHKINPINFENSEGNLGISNSILKHLSNKLPISRWQRDLSDSTVLRNIGVAIGYSLVAYQSTLIGLNKLKVNKKNLLNELEQNWIILGEALQVVMRRYRIDKSYEKVKKLTRGKKITPRIIKNFINNLNLPEYEKERLKKITPANYIGYASDFLNYLK